MLENSPSAGAVFISYASQDADAALRICEALREAGIEVWFDQSDLRGGDSWDALIKKQIHECALFLPIISAHTNARTEGYFRREWNLAARRVMDMAQDATFIVPVAADSTREVDARVPEEFLRAHWTRLTDGQVPTAFAQRVRQLLKSRSAGVQSSQPTLTSEIERDAIRTSHRETATGMVRRLWARVSGTPFVIVVVTLAVGSSFLWRYSTDDKQIAETATTANAVGTARHAAVIDKRPSIAVLPFENRSRREDDTVFVDGFHDDILTQLSKVGSLRVISRTSVERFRESKLSIKEIATHLGVTNILEGGLQRAGETVRIHVQLVDAANDAHLWAESYDRQLTAANMFAIQSEVASSVASALKASLTGPELTRLSSIPTRSLEAWGDYQLGKQLLTRRKSEELAVAEGHFRKAIRRDPRFALAWVGLADALALQMFYAGRAKESSLHEAEQAVARAIQIDANLAEAWASVGNIAQMRGQPERAEQMLSRAVELNPNSATAYHWLSIALMRLGRNDEALSAAESALVLDPLSAVINLGVGNSRRTVGRLDDAISAYQQAAAIEPTMALAYSNVGDTYWTWLGRFDKAGPWYEKAASLDPKNPDLLANVADTYLQLGEIPEAERWIARALAVSPNAAYPRFLAAQVSMHRGDLESARAHAKEAAEGNPLVLYLLRDDDLRRRDYATARARYAKAFPQLLAKELPTLSGVEALAAVDFALVLQHTGEMDRAMMLLDVTEAYFRKIPTMGLGGRFGIADAAIQALRGNTSTAVADLRKAEQAGWRSGWRYERDFDLNLESLRNEPEFKAVFADIELDIEKQRAAFAARPSELPLDFASFSK